MEKIHQFQDTILLSEKDVESIENHIVRFKDGSVANLEERVICNQGLGEIRFQYEEENTIPSEKDIIKTEPTDNIILYGNNNFFEIEETEEEDLIIEIMGSESFRSATKINKSKESILINTPENRDNIIIGDMVVNGKRIRGTPIEGKILLKTPRHLSVQIISNGNGKVNLSAPIRVLDLTIQGSLNVKSNSVETAKIKIQGSGDVLIQQIKNDSNVQIQGSGSVKIESGDINKFEGIIQGSGDIKANITVNKASLILNGSGDIYIERVKERSIESHQGIGNIKVGSRGHQSSNS